ncbi:MAG: PilW family protein [Cupriavidus sp.]|nr:PilW family protein [Cupriavidus sp.]
MRHLRRIGIHQAGLSIVEILVAMVIALFMLSALITMFLSMRSTFGDQDQLAQLQDNERLALTVFTNAVQSAGYFPDALNNAATDVLPLSTGNTYGDFAAGQAVVGTSGENGASDTLTARFATASGDGILNCHGQSNTSGADAVYINSFAVVSNALTCALDGGAAMPLVSGVTGFNVLYGTDTANDGNVDQYLSAAAVTAAEYWPQVRTTKVTVTFANPYAEHPGQPPTLSWTQTISLMNRS